MEENSLARLGLKVATSLARRALTAREDSGLTVVERGASVTTVLDKVDDEDVIDAIDVETATINSTASSAEGAVRVLLARASEALGPLGRGTIRGTDGDQALTNAAGGSSSTTRNTGVLDRDGEDTAAESGEHGDGRAELHVDELGEEPGFGTGQ